MPLIGLQVQYTLKNLSIADYEELMPYTTQQYAICWILVNLARAKYNDRCAGRVYANSQSREEAVVLYEHVHMHTLY